MLTHLLEIISKTVLLDYGEDATAERCLYGKISTIYFLGHRFRAYAFRESARKLVSEVCEVLRILWDGLLCAVVSG